MSCKLEEVVKAQQRIGESRYTSWRNEVQAARLASARGKSIKSHASRPKAFP